MWVVLEIFFGSVFVNVGFRRSPSMRGRTSYFLEGDLTNALRMGKILVAFM